MQLRRTAVLAALIVICLLPAGCFKKKLPPNPDAVQVASARSAMETLVGTYENQSLTAFINHFPFEFRGRQDAADLAERDFKAFQTISIKVYVDRINLAGDEVTLYTHWDGLWTDKSGKTARDVGSLIFVYRGDGQMKLTNLEGDPFFGKAVRRR